MVTTPPTRPTEDTLLPAVGSPTGRIVTPAQVDRAVLQLRERRGQTPVEQVKAVLRALDLTVQPATPDARS